MYYSRFAFYAFVAFYLLQTNVGNVNANRVLELSDKFLEIYEKTTDKQWLVMFYAPWCYHCKQFGTLRTYLYVLCLLKKN